VIFDDATTALDVTTQVEVLRAFREPCASATRTRSTSRTNLAVVRRSPIASTCCVTAPCARPGRRARILAAPVDSYTKSLLGLPPPGRTIARQPQTAAASLLEVHGLPRVIGRIDRQGLPAMPFCASEPEIRAGSALGVIGESGSGKELRWRASSAGCAAAAAP